MSRTDYVFKPETDNVKAAVLESCKDKSEAVQRVIDHIESGEWALLLPALDTDNLREDIKSKIEKH